MNYYKKILDALEVYFNNQNWKTHFLQGGCFWLANILHKGIPESYIMINRMQEHCALQFESGLYDVCGKISFKHFRMAEERDVCFMRKNYIPKFDAGKLEEYLGILKLV